MNKPRDQFTKAVWAARADNYAAHFAARQLLIKEYPADLLESLAGAAARLVPFPLLSIYGAPYDGWQPANIKKILERTWPRLAGLFNPYYLSPEGWEGFQILWKALPDPLDLWISPRLPVDNLGISPKKLGKSCGKAADNLPIYPQAKPRIRTLRAISRKLSAACG